MFTVCLKDNLQGQHHLYCNQFILQHLGSRIPPEHTPQGPDGDTVPMISDADEMRLSEPYLISICYHSRCDIGFCKYTAAVYPSQHGMKVRMRSMIFCIPSRAKITKIVSRVADKCPTASGVCSEHPRLQRRYKSHQRRKEPSTVFDDAGISTHDPSLFGAYHTLISCFELSPGSKVFHFQTSTERCE